MQRRIFSNSFRNREAVQGQEASRESDIGSGLLGAHPGWSGQAEETQTLPSCNCQRKGGSQQWVGEKHFRLPELTSYCSCLPEEAAKAPLLGVSFRTQVLWTHARKYRLLKVVSQLPSPSQETPVLQPHLPGS